MDFGTKEDAEKAIAIDGRKVEGGGRAAMYTPEPHSHIKWFAEKAKVQEDFRAKCRFLFNPTFKSP